jgi:hypothetical protein
VIDSIACEIISSQDSNMLAVTATKVCLSTTASA